VKEPVPDPSEVFESAIVGSKDVLQHTPLAVIGDPASVVMFPPDVAVDVVIDVTEFVLNSTPPEYDQKKL
jgi:hypothetical protein